VRSALLALYREAGVVDDESALELPDHCADAAACWKGMEERRYSSCEIARPWIGPEYERTRLLVVGENLNGESEFDALAGDHGYVPEAMRELAVRRRVRFGNQPKVYAGTLLWHCIGAYGAAILRELGVTPFAAMEFAGGDVPAPAVIAAYSNLAYLNHVKCSPNDGKRSQPSPAMWSRCGRRFLTRELEILAPRVVLVLGRGDNARRLAELLAQQWEAAGSVHGNPIQIRRFARDSRRLDLVVTPHPSYFRIPWRTIVSALAGRL
jgi:hypothetical protein